MEHQVECEADIEFLWGGTWVEDYLDKAVDMAQQYMGKGDQSNESALEQGTDEAISDSIRSQYKNVTGTDFPIADK